MRLIKRLRKKQQINTSNMKKLLLYLVVVVLLASCDNSGRGNLIGVQNREQWYQPDPFGMLYIPQGSYQMGVSDRDVPYEQVTRHKTVTVTSFYMDETEITNNEYRQFVHWVRDSIAHVTLGEGGIEGHLIEENQYGEMYDPPKINWKEKIRWDGEEERELLIDMYLPEHERFYRRKQLDWRKLNFEYYWIDYKAASKKDWNNPVARDEQDPASHLNRPQGLQDRSVYIKKDVINVYPDTLCWIHDFTYSYNEPIAKSYFWHPAYDHYPVVGVNWKQARAFCIWRTMLMNGYIRANSTSAIVNDFRLPTESEWEWAARGGLKLSPYPWGGPYIRNSNGCFLGNYKPLRGNYLDDGGVYPIIVAHYAPNDFGLYDMAGNVSEWTMDAYNEASYEFAHDMNMHYAYEAKDEDPIVYKRKVIRGGSWKDIGYYMQTSSRSFEYQDSGKSYVGFRCVQSYLGREKGDGPASSNVYN